jgi:hypothetical protein
LGSGKGPATGPSAQWSIRAAAQQQRQNKAGGFAEQEHGPAILTRLSSRSSFKGASLLFSDIFNNKESYVALLSKQWFEQQG